MARGCTICGHLDRDQIDSRILNGDSIASIAREYAVSEDALSRHHKNGHIPKTAVASPSAVEISRADNIFEEFQLVRKKTMELLEKAEEAGDTRAYGPPSQYIREAREQIKFLFDLQERIAALPKAQAPIYDSGEWLSVGDVLAISLAPWPEARRAAADALLELARGEP